MGLFLFDLTTGSWPAWITVIGVVVLCFVMWRGQMGPAVGYLTQANTVLRTEITELEKENKEKERELAELRAKTDITLALQPLLESVNRHELAAAQRHLRSTQALEAVAAAFRTHEAHQDERNTQFVALIEMVAERLGPEPNGNGH